MFEVGVVHVGVEIGVACHADQRLPLHRIARKRMVPEFGHQILHRDQIDLFSALYAIQPFGGGRNRHYPEHIPALPLQLEHHIKMGVFKADHRVLRVEHHRRKQGQHRLEKVRFAARALAHRQFGRPQYPHAVFRKFRF